VHLKKEIVAMLNKTYIAAVGSVLLAAGLTGCQSTSENGASGGAEVTLLSLTPSCSTCASLTESAVAAMEEQGIEVTTVTSEFGAGADQIEKFNQALSTNPDAIVVWPTDTTSIIPVLQRAKQSNPDTKIIVTTYKPETADTDIYDAFVGVDDKAMGAAQARALVDGLEAAGLPVAGGVLEIEGAPGGSTTILRKQGFSEELPKVAPNLRIVASQTANWDQTQATTTTSALIARNADANIVGIFAHSDIMLNGAILAATRAGMTPGQDFVAVGVDCDVEGYENIQAGLQYSTSLWDPFEIGSRTGEIAARLVQGEDVEIETTIPTPLIVSDNIGECEGALAE
jgi:ribose transport system substrate-binding protein